MDAFFLQSGGGSIVRDRPRRRRRGGPPRRGDDGGDGGDGDGDGPDDAPDDGRPQRVADLALKLALVAIGSLFLVFLALFVHVRRTAAVWPPDESPAPPSGLWVSTLLLAAASVFVARSALLARRGERQRLRTWLAASLVAGLGFLVAQAAVWTSLLSSGLAPSSNGYGALFYALTGLHAVHVLGGISYLALLTRRARPSGTPGPTSESVRLAGVYWHFMGIVWVAVIALLWMPGGTP